MPKFDGKLMHSSLQALCKPDEKYYYPVYGNVGQISKFSKSPMSNIYGFVAVTDLQRLLVAEFSMLGVPMGDMSIPLKLIKSMEVSKTIFGQNCVKLVIDNQGKDYKVQFTFANNVYGMGIPNQKENLDGLIKKIENRKEMQELLESYKKLQKLQAVMAENNMQVVPLEKMAELRAQQTTQPQKLSTQSQHAAEKPVQKPVRKGPDIVALLKREKEYALALCERLEAKYGKAEFSAPVTDSEMTQWETANQVTIPEDLKEWLLFSGASKLKGIPLEFYPLKKFKKEQDYVIIGKRESMDIGFLIENGRYIGLEDGKRKNLGQLETILRVWGYDAKELFAEEEIEKLRPVIEEYTQKMNQAEQKAVASESIKDAMEYFLAKLTIGFLKKWRTFPKCPVRGDAVNCGLVISQPDRDGYYQWKPMEVITPVDFTSMETELGFTIHQDIKAFVSSYCYFMLGADIGDADINIYPFLPTMNVEKYILDSFEKESYAGDYEFILDGQFFQLGGGCIDGDDSFIIEVNNKTGEVLAVEYMDKRHVKIADSLYDLFMRAIPEWYEE